MRMVWGLPCAWSGGYHAHGKGLTDGEFWLAHGSDRPRQSGESPIPYTYRQIPAHGGSSTTTRALSMFIGKGFQYFIRRTPLEYQNPPHSARRIFVKAQFCRVMHSAVMYLKAVVKPANGTTNRV